METVKQQLEKLILEQSGQQIDQEKAAELAAKLEQALAGKKAEEPQEKTP
ncbi:MAG: hypothetical protein PHO83_17370 [Geobacteraceae bacterium]|nr:hypothetical protein [Geobacteraceae bacterium]